MNLRFKILVLAFMGSLVTMAALFGIGFYRMHALSETSLVNQKKILTDSFDTLIRSQVQTAVSILTAAQARAAKGELTIGEAKKQGADLVRQLRFQKEGYFWIDTSDGINVVLLGKPIEGKSRIDLRDKNGTYIIRELIKKGLRDGGGYSEYLFPKAGSETPQRKRSYTLEFKPWGWIVGTGYYIDEIEDGITAQQKAARRDLAGNITFFVISSAMVILSFFVIGFIIFCMMRTKDLATECAEEKVADLNSRFTLAADSAHIGVWDYVVPENRLIWDKWMYTLYGIRDTDSCDVYEAWRNCLHPDDKQRCDEAIDMALRGENPFDIEFRVVRPTGELRHIKAVALVHRDAKGNPLRMIGVNYDITERKLLEQQLAQISREQRVILDASSVGIAMIRRRCFGTINAGMTRIFGYAQEELIGKGTKEFFVNPQEYDRVESEAYPLMLLGGEYQSDTLLRHHDGRSIRVHVTGRMINPGDYTLGSVWIFEDITARMALEQAHREGEAKLYSSQARLSTIFRTSPDLIAISDRVTGRFLEVNEAFERITGYCREETLGRTSQELGVWGSWELRCRMLIALGDSPRLMNYVTQLRRKSGEFFPVLMSLEQSELDGESCLIFSARDITEPERVKEELLHARNVAEAANRAKSEFLATMSHEIRTPMNAVIGLSDLTLEMELAPVQRDYLEKISTSARSLLRIINDILDLSKVEAGKLSLEAVDFSLALSLTKVADIIFSQVQAKGLAYQVTMAPDLPPYLHGDPLRLEQVLLNLLANAVKFTHEGRIGLAITPVETTEERLMLEFRVSDTGIGLSPKQCETIFAPFVQGEHSTSRRYGGTGLGLSICRRLVTLMGGVIMVESEPGKGSVFSFIVRFQPASATEKQTPAPKNNELNVLKGARLLLVEDNFINQQITRMQLTHAGLLVTVAANGREAVELTLPSVKPFDLVLMDIQMPEMDGYEATRRIRQQWSPEELPIIALTAHALAEERRNCLDVGMNDHLAKPLDVAQLHAALCRWLKPRPGASELPEVNTEPAVPEDGFRNLPGINYDDGLERLGGDQELYWSLLRSFAGENRQVAQRLEILMDEGDLKSARLLVRALRGGSGNLGIMELAATAAELERALVREEPAAARSLMADLAKGLALVLAGVTHLEEP